ncbi:cell division protein FtsA [Buchnera aphidicola (Neophyllaphis varicolor)]|uniref:cell division protein FtsA n=1 Tax=Buchnera aphidicola TaxID=9 RepID=UPI0031B87901
MKKPTDRELIVSLDIGTNKITVLVGEILDEKSINIIGIGNCNSKGVIRGEIVDLESVTKCIKIAITNAENIAKCNISSLFVSISGKNINCQNERGIVAISNEEVNKEDVENVIYIAQSVKISNKKKVIHVIPQEYTIDDQNGIKNPIGLSGIRMQANVHLTTCDNNLAKNIIKSIEKCNITINKLIFSGIASSYAVITEEEKKFGVCVIDIGGGTIDITIFINEVIQYNKVIPYAGNIVTDDISYAFNLLKNDAEFIKINYGSCIHKNIEKQEKIKFIKLKNKDIKPILKYELFQVIEARYIELLQLVNVEISAIKDILEYQINKKISLSIVLTGGGSKIKYLVPCAKKIFSNKNIRIGCPIKIKGLTEIIKDPIYSTPVGLLHYGRINRINNKINNKNIKNFNSYLKYIYQWLKKEF